MRNWIISGSIGVASGLALATSSFAAPDNMKLSQADCQAVWKQADSQGTGSLSQANAQPYVSDFKSVAANADGSLSSAEWMKGCSAGHVKGGASTGAGAGTSGSSTGSPDSPKKY
jgi:hypothetical protein